MSDTLRPGWITTYSGRKFWPLAPNPDDVDLLDIAHALSMLCRFTGHVREFYSVAQHCVLVSYAVPPADALCGLLHDAAEAYLLDLARPVKRLPELQAYRDAEARLQRVIYGVYGIHGEEPASIKQADALLLRTEQRDLTAATEWRSFPVLPTAIEPWPPYRARHNYLARFHQLLRIRSEAERAEGR